MATLNRPDRVIVDSYSDPNAESATNNGVTNRILNNLQTPLLNVKGIQLVRANYINSALQLNDYNGQLVFVYSRNTTTAIPSNGSTFKIIRLHPSWFVPYNGYTAFTLNKYFNSVTELVTALNAAAATGGDSATYNPTWTANDVTFAFDTTTRRITMTGAIATNYYAPVPPDHPAMAAFLASASAPKMNAFSSGNTYATAFLQPIAPANNYVGLQLMNARLGFSMFYATRGLWWNSSSVLGCASSTGVPQLQAVGITADSWPILQAVQNVNVYVNVVVGSGLDSKAGKSLLACIPMEAPSLGINSYTLSSLDYPALSVGSEINSFEITLLDDAGNPFIMPTNYNSCFELAILY
jgi:hypothetical protein